MTSQPGRYGIENALLHAWFHPGYWKTLARLRAVRTEVSQEGSVLRFDQYPFEPATVFPCGAVDADLIAEVNLSNPSQVRLKSGDILFVPESGKEALVQFINRNDPPVQARSSVWGALLDPFLDTWAEQPSIDRQFDWLASLGLSREAVDRWRREVAVAMMAYNFGTRLWEWAHLDLHDVLLAQRARLSRVAFSDFYWRAVRLAADDPAAAGWSASMEEDVASALFAVLIDWYPHDKSGEFGKRWQERTQRIERLRRRLAAELTSAYAEPHRRYHTLAHIEQCLHELRKAWHYAVHLNEVRWALLFHDAVYDPQRHDNESRSADWACRVMDELRRPEDEQRRVRSMIMATAHAADPRTADEALLLDIDLSILGADATRFDAYDTQIRAEYREVPEEIYRRARAELLESFLRRERLFHTAAYRRSCERAARENLTRALARLRTG